MSKDMVWLYLPKPLPEMRELFNGLPLHAKADLVMQQGKHLISTKFYGSIVQLYEFNNSFVEFYYHPVTNNMMRVSMATTTDMEKHLMCIDLKQMM